MTYRRALLLPLALAFTFACGESSGPAAGATLAMLDGDAQSGAPGEALGAPLRIVARDADGRSAAGVPVSWQVVEGGGSVTASSTTDANGVAAATFTLGASGPQRVLATTDGANDAPVAFGAGIVHARYASTGGLRQRGPVGAALPVAYQVEARDLTGQPLAGVPVAWTVVSGGGTVTSGGDVTDAAGHATASHTLGPATGIQQVSATIGVGDESAVLTFSTTALPAAGPVLVGETAAPSQDGIHDVFVRDGIAVASAWDAGVILYDIGNGVRGGSPSRPVELSRFKINDERVVGGPQAASTWWFHNPVSGERRYLFVSQQGPGIIGASSSGDIHVLDVSDLSAPRAVAFLHLGAVGPNRMWMDEAAQVLYAAYFDAGVVALDVSGSLSGELSGRILARTQPAGAGATYVRGVQLHRGSLYAVDMMSGLWQLAPVSGALAVRSGGNNLPWRFSSDVALHGDYAYTGSWPGGEGLASRSAVLEIWQLGAAGEPVLADSIAFTNNFGQGAAPRVSDLSVSDDGRLLAVCLEGSVLSSGENGLYLFDLVAPGAPSLIARLEMRDGARSATFTTLGGRRYLIAARKSGASVGTALMIHDVTGLMP